MTFKTHRLSVEWSANFGLKKSEEERLKFNDHATEVGGMN